MLWQAPSSTVLSKMQNLQPCIEHALRVLDQAAWQYRPSQLYALYSGGYDSFCATHIAAQHPLFAGVLHLHTGIGVEATRLHVRKMCQQFEWPLFEYRSPISYEDIVFSGGFPGPPLHPLVYSKLKERALRCFIRDHKRHFHDRILLAAGARRQESQRRMSTAQDMRLENTRIWANPLIAWSKANVLDYLEIYELPHNQVVDTLHMSGECLCGCFAQADELPTLEIWYPETAAYIYWLQDRVKERGFPWGWGQSPPATWRAWKQGQLFLPGMEQDFLPLCTSCDARFAQRQSQKRIELPQYDAVGATMAVPPKIWIVPVLPSPEKATFTSPRLEDEEQDDVSSISSAYQQLSLW